VVTSGVAFSVISVLVKLLVVSRNVSIEIKRRRRCTFFGLEVWIQVQCRAWLRCWFCEYKKMKMEQ
jgi:hypothetical protein